MVAVYKHAVVKNYCRVAATNIQRSAIIHTVAVFNRKLCYSNFGAAGRSNRPAFFAAVDDVKAASCPACYRNFLRGIYIRKAFFVVIRNCRIIRVRRNGYFSIYVNRVLRRRVAGGFDAVNGLLDCL